jgi:hypothetical protein
MLLENSIHQLLTVDALYCTLYVSSTCFFYQTCRVHYVRIAFALMVLHVGNDCSSILAGSVHAVLLDHAIEVLL